MTFNKPFTPERVARQLDANFAKNHAKAPGRPLQVRIFSKKTGLDYAYPPDSTHLPYHIASVGKVFAAVLTQRLAQRGPLRIEDPISRYFPTRGLEQLFEYRGVDYASQVTIEHLLGHTSGIADYFDGKTSGAQPLSTGILANPETRWTA
jgi:D-alanyl-D-alanine carboxypeptidase